MYNTTQPYYTCAFTVMFSSIVINEMSIENSFAERQNENKKGNSDNATQIKGFAKSARNHLDYDINVKPIVVLMWCTYINSLRTLFICHAIHMYCF